MNQENDEYAKLLELYAKKIRRFATPLTEKEKQLIEDLGKTIYKRQIPRMVKHKSNKNITGPIIPIRGYSSERREELRRIEQNILKDNNQREITK